MQIHDISVSQLIEYKNNPRYNDGAVDAVAESIKQFGFKVPIIVDNDYVIVAGHTRLKAARLLGIDKVPCIVADDLTPEQVKAFRLADNKVGELAGWDFTKLEEELSDISNQFDMSMFGFDMSDFEEETEIIEDEAPEVDEEAEPTTKLGDIWQLGRHRLMCGDSTDKDCVLNLMNGNKADMIFTDPPYGYKYCSNRQTKYEMLENDDKIIDYIPSATAATKENVAIYSFCGWQSLKDWLEYFEETNLTLKNIIIWKKNNWSMGDLTGAYAGQYEVILFLHKGRVELNCGRDTDIWEFDREPPKLHPTMKPLDLITKAIKQSSEKNNIVLDLFGGSGSTLIACEQLERTCYMMELDPKYCDVIIKRWETLTGEKAVLL